MSSPGIDKWITKNPDWWIEQVEKSTDKQTIKKQDFKKLLKSSLTKINKEHLLKHISKQNIENLYQKSKFNKQKPKGGIDKIIEKEKKPKKIKVTRKGKTYQKLVAPRWNVQKYKISLELTAKLKPRSKEYNEFVQNIVESTGRTRQAVVKKIQRTRQGL
jgi:hypothetical protein